MIALIACSLLSFMIQISSGAAPTAISPQTISKPEAPSGTVIGAVIATNADNDNLTYVKASGGTGYSFINIDSSSGNISLSQDYDFETMAASIYVIVEVHDSTSTATTTISITFSDYNDNAPVFSSSTYSFMAGANETMGTAFINVSATDADKTSPNKNIDRYIVNTSDENAEYFNFSGTELYLKYPIDKPYGLVSWSFRIYVIDGGSPALTGTATVNVTTPQSTTTTTTTEAPAGYDWFTNSYNVILFGATVGVCSLALGLAVVCFWRWHNIGTCLPASCPTFTECRGSCRRTCLYTCLKMEPDDLLDRKRERRRRRKRKEIKEQRKKDAQKSSQSFELANNKFQRRDAVGSALQGNTAGRASPGEVLVVPVATPGPDQVKARMDPEHYRPLFREKF